MSSMTKTVTGQGWLDRHGVTFDWSANGYQTEDGWEHRAYTITLTGQGSPVNWSPAQVELPWRQGLAVDDEPTPDRVLWAVASDVQYGEFDWSDFAREFGYDEDEAPLSQYRTWEACRAIHSRMYDFCTTQAMWEDFQNIQGDDADD